ncbi:MAG TPA: DMT family transporter [Candidatus Levybacteria bacterium]|nr:DMT family transporter [Candidatus Levybacteria bacterium]
MPWQFFLTLSITAEVFSRLMQRTLLKNDKSDPIAYAVVFQLFAGVVAFTYALFNGFHIPDLAPILPNLIAMPILWSFVNVFIFKSLKLTEASVFVVLFSSRAIWTIIGAIIFLNESFSVMQFFGTILIIASIILVSGKNLKIRLTKGELYALGAAVIFATAVLNDSYLVQSFDVPSLLTFGFLIPALLIWIFHPRKTKDIIALIKSPNVPKILLLSVASATAAITGLLAYTVGENAAQLGAIFQSSTIITILLAIVILKERSSLGRKVIAGILSFVGVLLIV